MLPSAPMLHPQGYGDCGRRRHKRCSSSVAVAIARPASSQPQHVHVDATSPSVSIRITAAFSASESPKNLAELGEISGVGPKKLALYGQAFLAVLNERARS